MLNEVEAMNWHYQLVEDGTNLEAINKAINNAKENSDKHQLLK